MMIIGGGRIRAQGTRAELLTATGTVVEAADLAGLDAALRRAGLAMHPAPSSPDADGGRRLVEAEPEDVARAAIADGIVLRRLAPAEGAGLEHLFFELTADGAAASQAPTDPDHAELAGAPA
jgi:ABC-2 type transport system ATP-binding protein